MEESGEPSTEASGDRGSCWMKRRMRQQHNQHEHGQDLHSLTDERAKALLEYRARCTSARFWIQSELLDLRVSCCPPSTASGGRDSGQAAPPVNVPGSYGDSSNVPDPGVVGDLPSLMRRHLTCPLLSKLLQQDPVLSGKLATLDHVLWHRRSKHEPQTSGWMSHDAHCPEGCSVPAPQGPAEALRGVGSPGGCVNSNGSSRSSTMDSMVGSDGPAVGTFSSLGAAVEPAQPARAAEDESRPITAWVSCEQCMEHFAYIAASLLVFLKPSELRDLAVERQQSHCCGFVFCGRRNVTTPEKRRAALWRWTLDFSGSKALSEDELVQFCCSRCCSRQQQLLRLLDEEPMYARPGIKEWIGDALQRKAAHRPHPHGLNEAEAPEEDVSSRGQQKQHGDSSRPADVPVVEPPVEPSPAVPVEMDVLLSEAPGRLEALRLVRPLLEKPPSGGSFSTESSSGELSKLGSGSLPEGFIVPVTVDDGDSSADDMPARDSQKQEARHVCTVGAEDVPRPCASALLVGRHGGEATNNFLMLDYNSGETQPDANSAAPRTRYTSACADLPSVASNEAAAAVKEGTQTPPYKTPISSPATSSLPPAGRTDGVAGPESDNQEQHEEPGPGQVPGTNCHAEPQIKSRGSRVRFADDDGDGSVTGDGEGESLPASVFKHFFNMQDEDDGPGFYSRADRHAAIGTHAAGGQSRNGTGELRSILKPATEPVDPSPPPVSSSAEAQVGYMRLSDVVIAFDLLSSCCTDASARFLAGYHRRFCTCSCEGAVPTAAVGKVQLSEGDESPKLAAGSAEGGVTSMRSRKHSEADESDSVSCVDGESGDEIEPSQLWRRRQQQLLKAILRSLPPSADSFSPLVTELCETFQPLQPLPSLRCSLCSCLAAVLLLLLLLLRARPLTCCCCCEGCRPWSNSHERHSRCQRRHQASAIYGGTEDSEAANTVPSFYFDDALTLAREEDVGLALVDFVRSTIHQSAPCSSPLRPVCGAVEVPDAAEAAETPAHSHEERALHVLLESIFTRMTRPIVQMCETARFS